jgi:hypothetical protein
MLPGIQHYIRDECESESEGKDLRLSVDLQTELLNNATGLINPRDSTVQSIRGQSGRARIGYF